MELTTIFDWIWRSSLQASVLVGLVLVVQLLLRKRLAARWRYALWLLPILRLMMPWSPESGVSVFNVIGGTAATTETTGTVDMVEGGAAEPADALSVSAVGIVAPVTNLPPPAKVSSAPPASSPPQSLLSLWSLQLPALWLIGAAAFLLLLLIQVRRLHRGLGDARTLDDPDIQCLLEQCKAQMGVQSPLAIVESNAVRAPALYGAWRPRLLLPPGLARQLGHERLRHVFLHELAHLKQADVARNWLVLALQVAHWFNPVLWYAFHRLRADRELACDEAVLARCGEQESEAYGETLIHLLSLSMKGRRIPGLVGINESGTLNKRRITMIAQFRKRSRLWSLLAAVVLVGLAVVGLTDAVSEEKPVVEVVPTPPFFEGKTFVTDPELIGKWDFADFVDQVKEFSPEAAAAKQLDPSQYPLRSLIVHPNGTTSGPWVWTKGILYHPGDKTEARYKVAVINGAEYLFLPWMSGDVTIRGQQPKFYVLKRDHSFGRATPTPTPLPGQLPAGRELTPAKTVEPQEADNNRANVILETGQKTVWRDVEVYMGHTNAAEPSGGYGYGGGYGQPQPGAKNVTLLIRLASEPSHTSRLGIFESFVYGPYEITVFDLVPLGGTNARALIEIRNLAPDTPADPNTIIAEPNTITKQLRRDQDCIFRPWMAREDLTLRIRRVNVNDARDERDDSVEILVRTGTFSEKLTLQEDDSYFIGDYEVMARQVKPEGTEGDGAAILAIRYIPPPGPTPMQGSSTAPAATQPAAR